MEKDKIENKAITSVDKPQASNKPVRSIRRVSGRSSLAQFIRTKEQAEDFMEQLERVFNKKS